MSQEFQCNGNQAVVPGQALTFIGSGRGGQPIYFNVGVFSSIVLPPSIYQLHLSGAQFTVQTTALGLADNALPFVEPVVNPNDDFVIGWDAVPNGATNNGMSGGFPIVELAGGDRWLEVVSLPNVSLQFVMRGPNTVSTSFCELIITKF